MHTGRTGIVGNGGKGGIPLLKKDNGDGKEGNVGAR